MGASGDIGIAAAGSVGVIANAQRAAAAISRKRIWHFSLGPRLRGTGQRPCSPEVPSKATLTAVVADVPL